jgi:hypothetical protein
MVEERNRKEHGGKSMLERGGGDWRAWRMLEGRDRAKELKGSRKD